jgi:hypothetical protein
VVISYRFPRIKDNFFAYVYLIGIPSNTISWRANCRSQEENIWKISSILSGFSGY